MIFLHLLTFILLRWGPPIAIPGHPSSASVANCPVPLYEERSSNWKSSFKQWQLVQASGRLGELCSESGIV